MTDINFDNVDLSKFQKNEDSQIDPVTGIDLSRFTPDPEAPARKEAFIRAQLKAQNVTPDKAVSAKNDGKALGVDYESALNNPEIIKQRKIAESAYYDDLAKKYPTTALFLNDPQNYAIAQGDEENLGIFEKSVKALDELGSAFGAGWRGMAAQDEGKIYFDKHILGKDLTKYDVKSDNIIGKVIVKSGEKRLAESIKNTQLYGQETQYYAKKGVAPDLMRATGYGFANLGYMAKNAATGLFEDAGRLASDIYENPTAGLMLLGAAGTAIASKGTVDPTKTLKAKDVAAKLIGADLAAFVVTDSFKQNTNEAHQLYTGVRDEEGNPMPANIAKTAAIMSGALNAGLDAAQFKMISSTFTPVVKAALNKLGKKGMNEAIAEALKRKSGRDIVKKYITTAGKLVLAEGAVEGAQSLIKDTLRLIAEGNAEKQGNAKFVSPTLFQGTDKEESMIARAWHDSVEAAKSTGGIALIASAPKAFAEQNLQRDIAKFEEDKAKLDAVNDAVNGTETVIRDPDTIARLARSFGGDADTKKLYMDAEKTRDLFQGIDPQRDPVDIVNELFGQETANRFSEALSTSTTFAVPFDAYVVKVMATGLYEQAKGFTQLNAYSLTAEDIANFEAMQQGYLNDLKRTADNIENAPSAVKQVYDDVYGQIESLNLPFLNKTDRSMFAALWAKKMATASIRKYQTPDKAYEMYDAPYKTKFVNEISKLNDVARGHFDNTVDTLIDSLRAGTIPKDSEIYGDTLLEGLRKLGIKDDRGDLKSMDVDKELKPFTRKLLRDDGMTLDDAAQWAVDNGYIQERDINALLSAIESDVRGNPVYNMTNPNMERLERKQRIEQLQDYFDKQGINISEFSNDELKALLRGDNQLYQQEQALKMMITHNLTEENLLHAMKIGGIPVPSLAIVNANSPLDSFGEITLLGSKEMADPKGYAKTKVFGADIYSPRYPSITHKVTQSSVDKLHKKLKDANDLVGGSLPDKSDIESYGAKELADNAAVKTLFLNEKGVSFDVVTKEVEPLPDFLMPFAGTQLQAYELRENDDFKKAVIANHENKINAIIDGETDFKVIEGIKKNLALTDAEMTRVIRGNAFKVTSYREQIKEKGAVDNYKTKNNINKAIEDKNLQSELDRFAQELLSSMNPEEKIHKGNQKFIPHTIENVIKILKTDLRGGEGFNYRIGSLRAKFTPEFKSLKQIKEEGGRLLDSSDFAKVKDEVENEFQLVNAAISRNGKTVSEDTAFGILEDIPKSGINKVIKDYNVDITEEGMQSIAEFLTRLKEMPTEYFEAKILRSVDISEFSGAVIPAESTQETRDILTKNGIQFREYEKGQRAQVLREFAYDLNEQGKNTLFQEEQKQIDAVRAKYEGTAKWMKAPNGKPTKLNELQWLQVRTPNFIKWFGDWENDPKNASKVIDENGEPLVVYHGGNKGIRVFNTHGMGDSAGAGVFLTDNKEIAEQYAGRYADDKYAEGMDVYPVFLNIRKIATKDWDLNRWDAGTNEEVEYDEDGEAIGDTNLTTDDFSRDARSKGYDGTNMYRVSDDLDGGGFDSYSDIYTVYRPEQIKSAIGNTGEFNKDNPNILYQSFGQGAKGFLSIKSNREMVATLTGKADFSTLLHESAHLWLEMMLDDLKSADVTQQAQNDWAVISNYFESYADKAKAEIIADHASLERDIKKLEGMKKRSNEKELELRQKTSALAAHKKAIAMIEANPELLKEVAENFGQSINDNEIRNILTKPYHEQFARSMEAYFREGKAPSTDLLSAFASFKHWLADILYPFLQMLGVTLTDDVRGVFDRMLATDAEIESVEQIQQAQKNFDAKMMKAFGMTDEQVEQYEKLALAAQTDAEDKLRSVVMRDELKKKKEDYQQELESIKQEVINEFNQRPIQILLHFLRTGEFKEGTESLFPIEATRLNTQDIVDTYGKQQLKLLPRGVYGHNGTHPDLVANAFGISSGSKMIEDLINEPLNTKEKANIYIKEEANRRMNDLHPDLVSIDALTAEAQKAIHGDKRAELLIAEMNALSKKTNKPFTSAAMLFDFAQRRFDDLLIEDINAAKYLASERKINRELRKQLVDGDYDAALVSVQKALFNQYMYNRAIKVEQQIKDGIEAAKRYDKKAVREKIAKGGAQEYIVLQDGNKVATFNTKTEAMDYAALNEGTYVSTQNSYLEMIDSIRGAYSFKKVPKWLIGQQDLFAKLYRAALNEGLALPFDPEQFAPPKNYTKLTLREFNDVIGALKVIEKVSNLSQGMETRYGKLDMDEVLTMMEQSVKGLKSRNIKFEHNKHFIDHAIEGIDSFAAFQSTIDSYVHALDGLEPGIFHDVLTLPQREAFIKEHTMLIQKDERVNTVFEPVYKEVDKKDILGQARAGKSLEKLSTMDLDKVLLGNRVHLASLNIDLSIQDVMGIAWLMGHKGGRDALMHPEMAYNKKSGGLWTEDNILKALEVLTPVQLKAVNDGWALYEKYWPEAQALDLRTLGYAPPKVDAIPYKIGDVEMTGGYSRLMYNKKDGWDKFTNFNEKAETMEDIVTGSGTRSQTNAGSTKERVGSGGKPPRLDFGVMDEHLNEIIHDIANREMVMQTYKLLKNQRFRNIIHSKLGEAALGQFNPWLLRLTKGEVKPTSILETMVGKANNATSIMFLGLSLFNAIQNATGLPVAAGLLGGNWVALGMAEFAKNPSAAVQFTMSKSGLIYVRRTTNQYSNDAKRALKNESFTGTGGSVARLAYAPQQIVQNMVDAAVWLGAYRKATAGKAVGVDSLNDKECVAFADRMIENTQSSGAIKDLSNLFARGEYMRMLTLMGSYFNMIFNMGRIRAGKRKYEPMTSRYYHDAMFALYVAAMPVLITSLMRFTAPEDDETWDEWAIRTGTYRDLVAYPFASVVVVRSAATAWAHPEYGFNAVPTLAWGEGIFKGTMAAGKLFDEDSEMERKDYKKMVEGVGYMFALPTRSVYKSGEPLYDYIDGNDSGVDELRVLRSVIFGKPRED